MLNDDMFEEEVDQEAAAQRECDNGSPYQDYGPRTYSSYSNNKKTGITPAVVSLIFGVLALVNFLLGINILLGIVSVICAIVYLTKYENKLRGLAIAGVITSVFSVVMMIGSYTYIFSHGQNVIEDMLEDMIEYLDQNNDFYYSDDVYYYYTSPDGSRQDDITNWDGREWSTDNTL